MGYNTNYRLGVTVLGDSIDHVALLRSECEGAEYALDNDGECSGNEARWHDHEADLIAFSKEHPGYLFRLNGDGEDSGDVWVKYFVNGQVQREKVELRLAEFDPSKLES